VEGSALERLGSTSRPAARHLFKYEGKPPARHAVRRLTTRDRHSDGLGSLPQLIAAVDVVGHMSWHKRLTILLVTVALVLIGAAGADGQVVREATLTPAPSSFANFEFLASSGGTVVAAGRVADVFTESSGGWTSGPPAAALSDGSLAAPFASAISISGDTVVEGLFGQTTPASEDVFVRPAGGWSGTVAPAARLLGADGQALTGGMISGQTVVADGIQEPPGVFGPGVVESVDVFTEPSTGWAGAIPPSAVLDVPAAANEGLSVIAGDTIFVASGHYVYVFTKPAAGWSGTVRPSARLSVPAAPGPISVSGPNVLVSASMFVRPPDGWSGKVQPVADVFPAGASGFLAGTALDGRTAVASVIAPAEHGCPCNGGVYVFSEPLAGWAGTEVSPQAISADTASGALPITLQGNDLFVSGGSTVDAYRLSGNFGNAAVPPLVSSSRLTGLRNRKPGLRFVISTRPDDPVVGSFTVTLPRGLAFTARARRLQHGVHVASEKSAPSVNDHGRRLTVGSFIPRFRLPITVTNRALVESKALSSLIRHRSKHGAAVHLTIKVRSTTTTGDRSTSTLKLPAS
jgi:hypothetical protein